MLSIICCLERYWISYTFESLRKTCDLSINKYERIRKVYAYILLDTFTYIYILFPIPFAFFLIFMEDRTYMYREK